MLLLLAGDVTAAHGVQIQADGGDGCLQLVRNGIQEAVLLLVAAHFADQEDGIEDESDDQESKKRDADDQRGEAAPVENDPAKLERDGNADQADTERDEEEYGTTAPGDPHRQGKV